MVSKVVESRTSRNESMKQQKHEVKGKGQKQEVAVLHHKKGKAPKFKRSSVSGEEDATSSAMLLLACIVCAPQSS
ncbi:hypothetical protein MRB53_035035 [Persea americana]|uniref:Uncharacterized protein n=1 Tax=Persea americana TaxID=3435 RepID=A0ACC2K3T1_PERAE|nr:hypothetical protein MRB53_035035 [Persea americana]